MRLLVIQHQDSVPLSRFAPWLHTHDITCEIVRPDQGDKVVGCGANGLLVLGGAMDAYADDAAPWLPATRTLLRSAIAGGVPTLGICLGHQLLATALGGTVTLQAKPGPEQGVGLVQWSPLAASDPVLRFVAEAKPGQLTPVPQGHSDVVTALPAKAQVLAASAAYPVQAFRYGSALGVQFHPEADADLIAAWCVSDQLADAGARAAVVARQDGRIATLGRQIVSGFAHHMRAAARQLPA